MRTCEEHKKPKTRTEFAHRYLDTTPNRSRSASRIPTMLASRHATPNVLALPPETIDGREKRTVGARRPRIAVELREMKRTAREWAAASAMMRYWIAGELSTFRRRDRELVDDALISTLANDPTPAGTH
jgi:hypothetical protein